MPPAFDSLAVAGAASAPVVAGLGAASSLTVPVAVGALALALVVGGGVATTAQPPASQDFPPTADSQSEAGSGESAGPAPDDRSAGEGLSTGDELSGALDGLVHDVTDPINAIIPGLPIGPVPDHVAPDGLVGALVDLDLNGMGMPKAIVSAQVAGQVYTTVVADNGTWALRITALPEGIGPVTLKQNLTILGITIPISIPLTLLSDTLGVTIELLN